MYSLNNSVDFNITYQLLIRIFAFVRYWRKNGNTMRQNISYSHFKKAYDSVRREVLYNILMEYEVTMKLVRLIKTCLNETYGKVHMGKHLSDSFPIQNGSKQGDALSPLLFNFALEYAIRKAQKNRVGPKLSGMSEMSLHLSLQMLFYIL
jgi:hypothetical protein